MWVILDIYREPCARTEVPQDDSTGISENLTSWIRCGEARARPCSLSEELFRHSTCMHLHALIWMLDSAGSAGDPSTPLPGKCICAA